MVYSKHVTLKDHGQHKTCQIERSRSIQNISQVMSTVNEHM